MAGNFTPDHDVTADELNAVVGLSGQVNITSSGPSAAVAWGTGFTVAADNDHTVTVTFDDAFTNAPLVLVQVVVDVGVAACVTLSATTHFTVSLFTTAGGAPTDGKFFFHAVEPQIGS